MKRWVCLTRCCYVTFVSVARVTVRSVSRLPGLKKKIKITGLVCLCMHENDNYKKNIYFPTDKLWCKTMHI